MSKIAGAARNWPLKPEASLPTTERMTDLAQKRKSLACYDRTNSIISAVGTKLPYSDVRLDSASGGITEVAPRGRQGSFRPAAEVGHPKILKLDRPLAPSKRRVSDRYTGSLNLGPLTRRREFIGAVRRDRVEYSLTAIFSVKKSLSADHRTSLCLPGVIRRQRRSSAGCRLCY